ncbi:hypothetical protein Hanom_Chr14g01336941 [Helianthus anomalus]
MFKILTTAITLLWMTKANTNASISENIYNATAPDGDIHFWAKPQNTVSERKQVKSHPRPYSNTRQTETD